MSLDDLIDFTPELAAQAAALVSSYRLGPIYTPPSLAKAPDGTEGTLMMPSATGGANWPGGSLDPDTGILYIYSKTQITRLALENDPQRSNMDFILVRRRGAPPLNIDGLPIVKLPWGRITAIDLNEGEIVWQVGARRDARQHSRASGPTGCDDPPNRPGGDASVHSSRRLS